MPSVEPAARPVTPSSLAACSVPTTDPSPLINLCTDMLLSKLSSLDSKQPQPQELQ